MKHFFFFQAEDGIRDLTVTGVQTCALPILGRKIGDPTAELEDDVPREEPRRRAQQRSEERRVGKECRSGRTANHYKKKIGGNAANVILDDADLEHAVEERAKAGLLHTGQSW